MNRTTQRGLTLLELIVAIALLALIGLATATTLNSAINNEKHLDTRAEAIEALSYALSIVRQDLEQVVNRPFIGPGSHDGQTRVMTGYHNEIEAAGDLLRFTRTGRRSIPGAFPGSRLQHIHYQLIDNQLIRATAPVPNPVDEELPLKQILLESIEQIQLHYYLSGWTNSWATEQTSQTLPRAVRITLTTTRWGDIEQIVLLPEVGDATHQ